MQVVSVRYIESIIINENVFESAQKRDYEHLLSILNGYITGSYDIKNRKHMSVRYKNLKYLYNIVNRYIKHFIYLQRVKELDTLLANEMITDDNYREELDEITSSYGKTNDMI